MKILAEDLVFKNQENSKKNQGHLNVKIEGCQAF